MSKTTKKSTLAKRKAAGKPAKAKMRDEIPDLIPLARHDEKAAARIWEILEERGAADNFVKAADVAYNAERSLIRARNSAPDVLGHQIHERRLEIMRRDLAGDNPSPLETLLIHRISLCWHHVHWCECVIAQNEGTMSLAQASYQEKRLDRAHKRYLAAIKALAQVRKLQLPTIQMNVEQKQLNIGTMNSNTTGAQSTLPEGRGGRLGGRLHESAAQENNR